MTRLATGICIALAGALCLTTVAGDLSTRSDDRKPAAAKEKGKREKSRQKPAKAADTPAKKDARATAGARWMEAKLNSSQIIFGELTHGNLKEVAKRAAAMQMVDALEYWLRGREFRRQSEYHKQMNQYQFAMRELTRTAMDEDIDGALDSWVAVSRSCVECHKLLRDNDPGKRGSGLPPKKTNVKKSTAEETVREKKKAP